jgi:outer membrane protein OmpA-like peptidoglycan-associated protein
MSRNIKTISMKRIFTLILLATLLSTVFSQNEDHKWSIGLMGGKTVYNGDYGNNFLEFTPFYGLAALSFDRYLNPSFDLGLHGEYGDWGFADHGVSKFRATKTDGSLMLRYKFYNGYIFKKDALIAPYLTIGAGIAGYSGTLTYTGGVDYIFPAGLGIKLNITKWLALQYQFLYYFTTGDKRDLKEADKNDAFAANTLGLIFSFGAPKDTDKDGVADKDDKCPDTPPGVKVTPEGCPVDGDGDGVPDYLDKCPTTYGLAVFQGCPDTDGDGVPDYLDKCPNTPTGAKVTADGCPVDTDGDGVPDFFDKCPDTPKGISVTADGCPVDTDRDGIPDYLDKCPNTPPGVKVTVDGCPVDTDGDGIPDYLDKCPTIPGIKENNGCPEIKAETKKVFDMALRGINFETGKAIIKGTSFQILNDIVLIMQENPEYKLEINGHTDDVGNDAMNLKLSQDRADAVKKYLVDKGIDPSRMTAKGYGETMPVADNKTSDGRALNRRVEFKVVF